MKSLLIFIIFLLFGLGIVFGYAYYTHQQNVLLNTNTAITTKFSLENAPAESLKGKISSMSGTVIWLSRTAKKPVKLLSPRTIQQGEELITGKNGEATVVVNNSAAVGMSPNSDINFIQLLPINFVMAQDKGTVIFQSTGQNALTVRTLDLITSVNNAWAVISVDPKAKTVTVTVQRGSVTEAYEDSGDNSNVVTVNSGSEFVFDDNALQGTVE
jgi:hypothetical protein